MIQRFAGRGPPCRIKLRHLDYQVSNIGVNGLQQLERLSRVVRGELQTKGEYGYVFKMIE